MSDIVNHPAHYTAYKGLEVIDLTEQMMFNRGNAVKYIARAGLKDASKEVEDLEKAIWYCQREIGRIRAQGAEGAPDSPATTPDVEELYRRALASGGEVSLEDDGDPEGPLNLM